MTEKIPIPVAVNRIIQALENHGEDPDKLKSILDIISEYRSDLNEEEVLTFDRILEKYIRRNCETISSSVREWVINFL